MLKKIMVPGLLSGLAMMLVSMAGSVSGSLVSKAAQVTMAVFLVSTLPGMWITYSSFPLSLAMVLSWTIGGIIQAFVAGLILAKLNA